MPALLEALDAVRAVEAEFGVSAEPTEAAGPPLPERYELVFGQVVEWRPMSDHAGSVANLLNEAVILYLAGNRSGRCGIERGYRIPLAEDGSRNRIPDWSFVSYERWPTGRPESYTGNARDVVPDIAAEVISPTDWAIDVLLKVREYLRGGVRVVWVVYPLAQEVHAYRPDARDVRVYQAADTLDAGDVLPGFAAPVGPLFPPVEPPPAG